MTDFQWPAWRDANDVPEEFYDKVFLTTMLRVKTGVRFLIGRHYLPSSGWRDNEEFKTIAYIPAPLPEPFSGTFDEPSDRMKLYSIDHEVEG